MKLSADRAGIKTILAVMFVISGAAGLVYQVVWFKYLSLFLGNTTYAQMAVLASFLGGLAIGNFLIGKRIESYKNPVRIYAFLETAIGIYCLLYPSLSSAAGDLFINSAAGLRIESQFFFFNLMRFALSSAMLLLPTIAMGGTLPALSVFFVDNSADSRKDIASLYFLNSFGAVVGIVFVGFVLIKTFGLDTTIYATAVINIIVGAAAFVVSKKAPGVERSSEPANEENLSVTQTSADKSLARVLILVAGLSGMAALLYEMVWVRLLINFLGSSTYAFSIMLLSFISGITIGSLIVSLNFVSRFNYIKLIAYCQFLIAASTMAVLLLYARLPYYLWKIAALLSKTDASFPVFLSLEFLICFLLILLPTLFMGMSLPLIVDVISASTKEIGFSVGKVFSVNTLGTVAGVFLTGLVFMPAFGIKTTFEIGVAVNIAAAVLIIFKSNNFRRQQKWILSASFAAVFTVYAFSFSSWDLNILSSGVFKRFNFSPPETFAEFERIRANDRILFYKEGINANVAVTQAKDNPLHKSLIINGKPDASTYFDMPTQVMLGQLPLMLNSGAKNVFVVGFGSGTTIGSVLTHPVEKVVCAEISNEVIEAAKFFEKENNGCLNDPRLELINEDALTLLKLSHTKYDVIISEPSNPWIAGIANLFSEEYFRQCYSALDTGGVMVQWFHLYEADDDVVKLVLNTFRSVFKTSQLWSPMSNDILLVGTKGDVDLNIPDMKEKFDRPSVKNDFERIGINSLFTFLSCQSASPEGFYTMTSERPVNSEYRPLLEFLAPKSFYVGNSSRYIYSFDEKFDTLGTGLYIKKYLKEINPDKIALLNAADYNLGKQTNIRFSYGISRMLSDAYPGDYSATLLLSKSFEKLGINSARGEILKKMIELFPDSIQIRRDYNNIRLLENLNATTFLKIFPIDEVAGEFMSTADRDSLSQLKTTIQIAKAFLQNSQFDKAFEYSGRAEAALEKFKLTSSDLNLSDFYYTSAMTNMIYSNYEKTFSNYLALVNLDGGYPDLLKLRKKVGWFLSKNNSAVNSKSEE